MNTFFILLLIATHVLMAWLLIQHRRNVRHHQAVIGTIGRDLRLTDALHERLRHQPAQNDWRDPVVMRAKVAAWRNANKPDAAQRVPTNNHGGVMIDALACLGCAGILLLLIHVVSQYVLQTGVW